MGISAAEAALAGAAISAVASSFVAVIVQRYTTRSQHTARLWRERIAAYEYALSDARWWSELRTETSYAIQRGDFELIPSPPKVADTAKRRRLLARLQMFGESDVSAVYAHSREANKQFIIAVSGWRKAMSYNRALGDFEGLLEQGWQREARPEGSADDKPVDASELLSLKLAAEAAINAAERAEGALVAIVHDAVERLPKYERRLPWTRIGKRPRAGSA